MEGAHAGRPCLTFPLLGPGAPAAVRTFLAGLPSGAVLNVAGPGESEWPGAHGAARALLEGALGG